MEEEEGEEGGGGGEEEAKEEVQTIKNKHREMRESVCPRTPPLPAESTRDIWET